MFDVATRPTHTVGNSANGALMLDTPFDWRLAEPLPAQALPWHHYSAPDGRVGHYAESLAVYALRCEDTLATAIIISLFTDARAGDDDSLPYGSTERRGWLGEHYLRDGAADLLDAWGNKLWLLYISKHADSILELARFTAQESLQWLLRDGIARRMQVIAQWVGDVLAVRPIIWQADSDSPIYDVLWATSIRRGMGGDA